MIQGSHNHKYDLQIETENKEFKIERELDREITFVNYFVFWLSIPIILLVSHGFGKFDGLSLLKLRKLFFILHRSSAFIERFLVFVE